MAARAGKRSKTAPESVVLSVRWFEVMWPAPKIVLAYIIDGRCDEGEMLHFA